MLVKGSKRLEGVSIDTIVDKRPCVSNERVIVRMGEAGRIIVTDSL